jgi:hypothetical protein
LVAAVTPQRFARARHRRQPIRQSETPSRVPIRHLFSRENLMSLRFSLEKRWRIGTREGVSDWRIGWRIGWRLPCSRVSIMATVQLPGFWTRGGARHGRTELAHSREGPMAGKGPRCRRKAFPFQCLSSIRVHTTCVSPGASALAAQPRRWSGPRRRSCRGQRQTSANKCLMLCASRSNVRTLKKFAFVDGATVYLTRTNDEAAQQERRRLDSHVCRISTGTDGKQTGGAFVGRGQELVFTPKTTAPGHGRERVFTQAKQVLFSHVGPRPVTKTQEAAQSPL